MRTRIGLMVYLSLPLAIVAVLMWAIAGSLREQAAHNGPRPAEPAEAEPMSYSLPQPEDRGVQPETLEQGFIIVADDPGRVASESQPMFIGTNHGNWHPGNPVFKMSPRSDGKWQMILAKPTEPGRMQFKFTRGTWETVEVSAENEQIENRVLPLIDPADYADGSKPVFEFSVPKWADQLPGALQQRGVEDTSVALEVTGTAKRLQLVGGAGRAVGLVRDAIVWLPPGYADSQESYPVLYLMDGQNVFMQQPGTPGEWRADETASELIADGSIEPMIIVAIPHSGFSRADEYLPAALIDGIEPSADEFIAWIERSAMPRVQRAFRAKTGPANTAIGGASFGGVFSLYAAGNRPDLFGKAIVESPSVLSRDGYMMTHFAAGSFRWPATTFLGMGAHEAGTATEARDLNDRYVAAANRLAEVARAAGADLELIVGEGHVHNEKAWADRFPAALRHLYGR
jgi:predicted alpha/beta superfamily hydrolase